MKKKFPGLTNLLFAIYIVFCCPVAVMAQDIEWDSYLISDRIVRNGRCAVDANDNLFITGSFVGDTLIAATTVDSLMFLKTKPALHGFLIKYSPDGKIAWGKQIGSTGWNDVRDVAVDAGGNVYITGAISDTVDFNSGGTGGVVTASPRRDIYLAKYDNDGNFIWARNFEGKDADEGERVCLDTLGNVYIMGSYRSDTVNLNSGGSGGLIYRIPWPTYPNIFIAKYDTSGNYKWGHSIGYNVPTLSGGFAVSPSGDVIFSGNTRGTFTLDSGSDTVKIIYTGTNSGGFFAKYNTDGILKWAYDIGSSRITSICITNDNNILFTGTFSLAQDMDYSSNIYILTASSAFGNADVFLSQYGLDGNFLWTKNLIAGTGYKQSRNIVTDLAGNIYVSGRFGGKADFNYAPWTGKEEDTLTTKERTYDLFIAKYKSNGDYVWARNAERAGTEDGSGLTVNSRGSAILAGFYEEDTTESSTGNISPNPDLLSTPPLSMQKSNAFILQLSCKENTSSFLTDTVECGAPYTLNGKVYTAAGTYVQHRPNTAGCDSIITFELIYTELNPEIIVDGFTLSTNDGYSSYLWLKDGKAIADATTSQIVVREDGDYQVIVTNQYGCSDTSIVYPARYELAINDDNHTYAQIKVYPNPVQEKLYIQSPVSVDITLTGIDGRILTTQENTNVISLKDYADGIYFLRVSDREGRLIKVDKIIKK